MGPDNPMRDIVDSCRVWESHTEVTDSWSGGPDPEYPRAIYQVAEDTQSLVALKESDETVIADAGSVASEGDSHTVGP